MLQISIVKLSDIKKARRFDAEYFKPEYLEIENRLEKIENDFLFNLASNKYQNFSPKNKEYYFKYIEISKINLITGEYEKQKILNSEQPSRAKKVCKNFDLLISTVRPNRNAVSLVLEKEKNLIASTGFCKLSNIKTNPYFLFILFKTTTYIKLLDRKTTSTQYPAVNEEDILNIKIPILPQSFQLEIEKIVKEAHQKQATAKELYKEAEQILLEELGFINYQPKHSFIFTTTKKEIDQARRFDAEYFQPKYKKIIKKIEDYRGGFDLVEDIIDFNTRIFFPEDNELYSYLPLSKVSNNGEIAIPEKKIGKELPTRARIRVKEGEIILSSIEGSLETSALITKEYQNFIVSNGFYVFSSRKINSETLFILFKSKIMIELLKKISKGAILGGYDLVSFKNLPIPLLPPNIQTQIADKVTLSHVLRKESKALLEQAKQKIEQEIKKTSI